MEMAQLTDHHRKLEAFAGAWSGEEKFHPTPWDPTGGPATATMDARVALNGFFLVLDHATRRDGQLYYAGHGVWGFDAGVGDYTMAWFDSMGSQQPKPNRGTWQGNALTFREESPQGHTRYVFTLESPGRMTMRIDLSQDGQQWMPYVEGRYSRS
jgi:hypothetical protein